jgi:hypothetical protein
MLHGHGDPPIASAVCLLEKGHYRIASLGNMVIQRFTQGYN